MKLLALCSLSLLICFAPSSLAGPEETRLRKILAKKNHEIAELRKEVDALHRQLAEEQPYRIAKSGKTNRPAGKKPSPARKELSPETHTIHIVASGDTLSRIANQHQTSVAKIKSDNGLTSHIIQLGQKLKIRSSAPKKQQAKTQASQAKKVQTSNRSVATRNYKIQAGDTFYSIARKENMSIAELRKLNPDTDASRLRIGQIIKLSKMEKSSASSSENTVSSLEKNQSYTISTTKKKTTKAPKTIAEVELDKEMTFSDFASQQGMSMERLNELNGHKLAATEWLASGSVFYVEK